MVGQNEKKDCVEYICNYFKPKFDFTNTYDILYSLVKTSNRTLYIHEYNGF